MGFFQQLFSKNLVSHYEVKKYPLHPVEKSHNPTFYIFLLFTHLEEVAKIFELIKEKIGVKHDVEVLRYLINYYKEKELKKVAEQKV